MSYDWSSFHLKINIHASLETIFDAWTVPHLMEQWLFEKAEFRRSNDSLREQDLHIARGDQYSWWWFGQNEPDSGTVREVMENEKIEFTLSGNGLLTIHLGRALDENIVMLSQEKIPVDNEHTIPYHLSCRLGWTFYLTNLKSYLEGGIDLRNKNRTLTNMVNS